MIQLNRIKLITCISVVVLATGCSTTPKISYGDAKSVETVTSGFGSTDLNQIAEAMTRSLLQTKSISASSTAPVITLAEVKNKTSEYIDTRVITEKIRTQLTKSGQVRFAVSISEMQNQTDELKRQNQSGLYKEKGSAKIGNMQGAKYRIEGTISSIVKQNKTVKDIYYIFNLSLIDNESGLIEWADEKEIRKTELR
uniref:penicillin-binding protein activator LpoB n=1 Tax=Polynucleobacter sp. TaxID=2029855 RepID=UPI004048D24C